jgi:hypothetical protein
MHVFSAHKLIHQCKRLRSKGKARRAEPVSNREIGSVFEKNETLNGLAMQLFARFLPFFRASRGSWAQKLKRGKVGCLRARSSIG